MTIDQAPSYAAFEAKKAELKTEQDTNGAQTVAAQALGNEAWALLETCCKEAGVPFLR